MSTGKTHTLLLRNAGLERRRKPPVCVIRHLLRFGPFFLASLLWKGPTKSLTWETEAQRLCQKPALPFLQETVLYWKNSCSEDYRCSCTVVTGTLKGGKTNKQQRRFLANTFGFYRNCEHGPALPSVCCANVHTAHVQAGELRSCVHLHHLLPANRVTGESLSCLIPANGVGIAGISPDPACPHSSSGKGSCLPWFLPLTPLRALKARKVCRFVCFGVSNFTCMTV